MHREYPCAHCITATAVATALKKPAGHYRFSTEVGVAIARKIGELAVQNYMILLAND